MLDIRSRLIYPTDLLLCILWSIPSHFLPSLTVNHCLTPYLCIFKIFKKILYISEIMRYVSFCVWLISLSQTSSGFIYIVANSRNSLFNAEWYSCVCVFVLTRQVCLSLHLLTSLLVLLWKNMEMSNLFFNFEE